MDGPDPLDKILFAGIFENISHGPGAEDLGDEHLLIVHGEADDPGLRVDLEELFGGLDPIEVRHTEVHGDNIHFEPRLQEADKGSPRSVPLSELFPFAPIVELNRSMGQKKAWVACCCPGTTMSPCTDKLHPRWREQRLSPFVQCLSQNGNRNGRSGSEERTLLFFLKISNIDNARDLTDPLWRIIYWNSFFTTALTNGEKELFSIKVPL